jgi:predicted naringenin-chalcone synthase
MTMRTAVVNSLFGDGVAALVVGAGPDVVRHQGPAIYDFESHIIPDAIAAMRFDLDGPKFSFYLDRDIPYVLGTHVEKPVNRLLARAGLKRRDIQHWIIHSGGRKVIDAMKYNLGITNYDVRHTLRVLQDFGNLSSGAFLFSYQLLLAERLARSGEYGVMITMGPGSTIETCLIRF